MKKPSLIRRLFSFLLRVVVVLFLMVVIAAASFEGVTYYLTGSLYDLRDFFKNDDTIVAELTDTTAVQEETVIDDENTKSSLFFVESEDHLSRYTSMITMNTSTKAVDILLIPLHSQVTVGGSLLSDIQKKIPNAGSTLELDDIARAYGDEKYEIVTKVYEQILGIKISGYDVLTQAQFENLLDIAGPVSYQLPDQLSYRDSSDKLEYLEEGDQELDGSKAMILIGHLDGSDKQESDRLENTNTYLESWLQKALAQSKGKELVEQVKSTASSSEGRDYTEETEIWNGLSINAVTMRILQGAESGGLFVIDSQKARLQLATLLKQSAEYSSSGDQDDVASLGDEYGSTESSKEYFIELYNAAFQQGLASSWENYLEDQGYNISLISNYQEEGPISTTRIIVNREGIGLDLLKYFPEADIQTGEIDTGGDIQVYIGTDSINVGMASSDGTESSEGQDTEEEYAADSQDTEEDSQEESSETDSSGGSGYYNFDTDSE